MYFLENIKRVKNITLEAFKRDFVECRQPVIIEELFYNTPLEQLSTLEAARSKLGQMKLTLERSLVLQCSKKWVFFRPKLLSLKTLFNPVTWTNISPL
jgi:hypothetical protein